MKSYRVIKSPLILSAGAIVGLSDHQAASRSGSIAPEGKGLYRVLSAIQFKAGEAVLLDDGTAKALRAFVEDPAGSAPTVPVDVKAAGGKKLSAELDNALVAIKDLRAENAALAEENARLRADLDSATAPPPADGPTADAGDDLPPAE